jgi:hypothetical protein
MVSFTINIPPMLVYIPYMDPMGYIGKFIIPTDEVHHMMILKYGIVIPKDPDKKILR